MKFNFWQWLGLLLLVIGLLLVAVKRMNTTETPTAPTPGQTATPATTLPSAP